VKNTLLVLLTLLFISSCPLFIGGGGGEPVYNPDIVWKTEVYCYGTWSNPFEVGGYGYYPEEFRRSDAIRYCSLVKIDLSDGEIIWRTEDVRNNNAAQAQKIGDYLYFPLEGKDIIMVYNDVDGSLAATISLKPASIRYPVGPYINTAVYNNYIFWGNLYKSNDTPHGLMRFDTTLIDFTKDPEDVQLIEAKLIWEIKEQADIHTNIIVNNGKVYFLTTRHDFPSGWVKKSYLVSLDAETGSVVWVTDREFGWGDRENSLLLKDDKLYVIDKDPSCYNVNTGEPIFERDNVDEYNGAGFGLKGIFWYDNKLFYTTGMHSHTHLMDSTADPKLVKNIICIDGNTGNTVWGDLVPNGATIYTFPLVNKGKAYVVTDEGLRVYNANDGTLIGVDKTVLNLGRDHNLLYNNMVIYLNYIEMSEYPYKSILTAIKAD